MVEVSARRAAAASLAITFALAVAKFAAYLLTSSLAILSQTLDTLVDVVALALVYVAVRVAERPADRTHHYGHHKIENLVAYTQTLMLLGLVGVICFRAVSELASGTIAVTAPWYAFALMGLSVVVDAYRVRSLVVAGRARPSQALAAGALNLAGDLGTALVTLIALGLVQAGVPSADAIGSLVIAAAVTVAAVRLGKRSVDVLMDRAPEEPLQAIERAANRAAGVADTRRVRVRDSGGQLFADVTVSAERTTSLERAHDIAESVEREIARVLPGTDVVVHVEPDAGAGGLVERAHAAASRVGGVHEVHNVSVRALSGGGRTGRPPLRVTLHAKVDPATRLEDAHELADAVEAAVARELGGEVRVDSHIEPLEPTTQGRDVTDERRDLVDAVVDAARAEPDVLDCHDVTVTSSPDGLIVTAHLTGRRGVALDHIHAASQRMEKEVMGRHPDVAQVVTHFEPTPA